VWALGREGLDVVPPWRSLRRIAPWALPAYAALLLAVNWLRAARWRHLLAPIAAVPVRRVIAVSWVGFAAIAILPLRLGELARPLLIADERISRSAALGTIAAERVLDGVVVSMVLAASLLATPDAPAWIGNAGWATLALFAVALAALYAVLFARETARRWTERALGLASRRLGTRVGVWVTELAAGLSALPDRRALAPFLLETILYWAVNAFSMWVLARGCGLDLSLLGACSAMAFLAVGILLPTGPGLFGNFQYAVFLALGLYLPADVVHDPGSAYVFVLWASQMTMHVLLAAVSLRAANAEKLRGSPSAR